jgi:exonuclease SbcD
MTEIRIIHTSDIHLGAPFLFLGARGEEHRGDLRRALERTVAVAREGPYHAIVIAGDLFDSAFAARESDVSFAAGCLSSAGSFCRVVILPGSHDCLAPGSVLERERLRFEAAGNVFVLTPERPVVAFRELSLAVHGRALLSPAGERGTFAGLAPLPEYRYNICLAHGSAAGAGPPLDPGEEPLRIDELAPGFDYLALGHWHSYRVVREELPPAVYSGSPEIIARDQRGAGSIASVSLSPSGARIERVPVGRRRIEELSIDCTGMRTTEELVKAVMAAAEPDPDLILELTLAGYVGMDAAIDSESAAAALAERYFSVRTAGGGPAREIARTELLSIPEETVAGMFVRIMLGKIEKADPAEREILEEALQIGVQLMKGRDPT